MKTEVRFANMEDEKEVRRTKCERLCSRGEKNQQVKCDSDFQQVLDDLKLEQSELH